MRLSCHRTVVLACAVLLLMVGYPFSVAMAQLKDVLWGELERYAKMEGDSPDLAEDLRQALEKNPGQISKRLLPKLKQPEIGERRLAIYIWALGLTREPMAVDDIISLVKDTKSDLIKRNSYKALANIGGPKSGEYLLSLANQTNDDFTRFGFLNLLGQMQYPPALPKSIEILKKDPKEFYWQNVFFFVKMGDPGVSFLVGKIGDPETRVRTNAIQMLSQWLVAPEAVSPLQEQFWKESNLEIRGQILGALEWVTGDIKKIKEFSESVAAKEKDKDLVNFASETLKSLKGMEEAVASFKKQKKISEKTFQEEYDSLYSSFGKSGDYRILSISSKPEDEAKLKKLRERLLQRDSDQAFSDVKKINETIIFNRLMKNS